MNVIYKNNIINNIDFEINISILLRVNLLKKYFIVIMIFIKHNKILCNNNYNDKTATIFFELKKANGVIFTISNIEFQ